MGTLSTLWFTLTDRGVSFANSWTASPWQKLPGCRTGRSSRTRCGAVEVLHQQECLDGLCGDWELKTLPRDIKENSALGIEIRNNSVEAAVVELSGGRLLSDPCRVELNLTTPFDRETYATAVSKALRMATAHLQWKGVIGCVVTKLASGHLGVTDAYFTALQRRVGQVLASAGLRGAFTHAMLPAEAAGYAELAASAETGNDQGFSWRGLVVVATIGAKLDAVLFKDGHRVRRSGINTMIQVRWSANSTTQVPEVHDPRWPEFHHNLDQYLSEIVELTGPDRIVLVPIGVLAARVGLAEAVVSDLELTRAAQTERADVDVTIEVTAYPADALVRGSALAALVELRSVSARLVMQQALQGTTKLNYLSPAQLRAVFNAFDLDGNGELDPLEMQNSLDVMGISRDISDEFKELKVSFERFQQWWLTYVDNADVLQVSSLEDVERMVAKSGSQIPERFGPLLVLEVSFSYCRVCRAFAKKYDMLAKTYADVRFLQVQGNLNRGTISLVKRINVTKAPAFYLYRRGSALEDPIAVWHGGNVTRFKTILEDALLSSGTVLA